MTVLPIYTAHYVVKLFQHPFNLLGEKMQKGIRKSRPTTMAEFLQQLREKREPQTKLTMLDMERKYLPAKQVRIEEETMYFGA